MTTRNKASTLWSREEIRLLIDRHSEAILDRWKAADPLLPGAPPTGGVPGPERLGQDLIAAVVQSLGRSRSEPVPIERRLMDLIRTQSYSVRDLHLHLRRLERTIPDVLRERAGLSEGSADAVRRMLREEIDELLQAVLKETSEVYEAVLESEGRGFCQLDADGRIQFANAALGRLVGCDHLQGRNLVSCLEETDGALVAHALQGQRPLLRPLVLKRDDGRQVPVAAEIAPLIVGGVWRGAYAGFVDISGPMELQRGLFDRSPLGIVRVNLQEEILYANAAARTIMGSGDLCGHHLRDLFDDPNYAIVRGQLLRRMTGQCDEYRVQARRPGDGKAIPLMIAAVPETDLEGQVIGAVSIVRNVLVEDVTDRIQDRIHELSTSQEILEALAEELRRVIDYDFLAVSVYSSDGCHARALLQRSELGPIEFSRRWWPLTRPMAEWIDANRSPLSGDLAEQLEHERWRPLRDDPVFRRFLDLGLRYFFSLPVLRSGRVVAAVTLYHREPLSESDVAAIQAIPVEHAVLMALGCNEREDLNFRLNLLRAVSAASNNVEQVGRSVVDALAKHYQWSNVALFKIDFSQATIALLAQSSVTAAHRFPPHYTQPLEAGILGLAYREGRPLNIPNTRSDPHLKEVFIQGIPGTVSELCVPILVDGRVRWLLNVEDERENAFTLEEQESLRIILDELGSLLERSREHQFLKVILNSASDAVIVTDEHDVIRRTNPAAATLLGYSEEALRGLAWRSLFVDPKTAELILRAIGNRADEVFLLHRDGAVREVLLSASRLPGSGGGRVFVARDLLPYRRAERLDALERVFSEIAAQVKTPLSLIHAWLRRLEGETGEPATAATLRKVQEQLLKVGLTYDRLFLAEGTGVIVPYHEILLDLSEIMAAVREELPQSELELIDFTPAPELPPVRGDLFQLRFCVMTLLANLLRFLPEGRRIRVGLRPQGDWISLRLAGFLPVAGSVETEGRGTRVELARLMTEVSLGEEVIRRFMNVHHGRYHRPARRGAAVVFQIDLPIAKEDCHGSTSAAGVSEPSPGLGNPLPVAGPA